ncbi:structural maintenance of chromosomes protein 5-like [Neocloeon triangulifer]|uniref:structural maintenance of chromosomes protein 5-like n=1 Tax=Neocloeon triangulifer TaxID=2078957 RepID=UPI00286F6D43|nr:structural maintenance of chromosomes protein 5-like [Neocloeon triangulifer]
MRGKIKKITLTNFITYEYLELDPGAYMNLVIGPNGSGKSSILCGMCLGLAGKPSSIGRVTRLSDYIKTGCNRATIEIELDNGKSTSIITRIINKGASDTSGGTTVWSLNGKTANQKEVEKFVRDLNIQMDNLCQFLSQERVQDFTKMNSKDLLINTEKTVGNTEMYENHQKLIELCKSGGGQEKALNDLEEGLIRQRARLDQLQVRMQSMQERLALVKQLDEIKAKIPWVEYNEHVESMQGAKNDKEQARKRLEEMEKELKPLEKSLQQLTERLKLLRAEAKKKTAGPVGGMKKFIEEEDKQYREIQKNVAELRDIDKQKEKFKNDLALLEQKIISNKERLQEIESTTDLDAIKQELQDLNQQAREVVKDIESIRQKESGKRRLLNDFIQEIRNFEYEIKEQSNLAERRLAELSGLHRLSYNATVYLNNDLRKNHQFAGKVYSSIVLEINTTDPRASRYLNIVISRRDKIAFLCEKSEDFNFLFMHLKQKFGNGLNMLTQGPEVLDLNQPIGMEALRKMGFDDYLSNLIACPTEIYNYLCKTYRLHQIPVAFKDGQVNRQDASQTFNQFFIGDTMYRISTSKYTNEKSSRTIPITNKKNPFDITIDLNAVAQLKAMKDKKVEERDALQREMQEMNAEVDPLQRKQDALRNKMKELRNRESQMNELQSQIRRNESSLETKKQNQGDFDKQKEKILIANQRLFRDAVVKLDDFKKHLKKCYSYDVESGFANMEVRAVSKKHLNRQNELDEKKRTHKDFLRTYQNVVEAWNRLKSEAARLKAVAEKTIGCTPKDPKFKKMQEIFAKLPATLLELDDMKTDLESRLEFMDSAADENIAELLERQKTKVSEMERQLAFIREQVTGRKTQMDRLKETWLPALEELADRISVKFERLFNYMGCEGTVKLLKGNAETQDDYENYGLSIQVSFRAGESLQELGGTQSGGERSVSTAIYLLALQELTEVPFRCLDEINQGMDATNERRIMELMMKMSGNEDSCQYFLVSPKLLANLVYVNTCRVLCVQQPLRMDTTKWTMAKFILKKQMEVGEKRSRTNGRAQDNDETEDDN